MRWIEEEAEYKKIRLHARDCVLMDSGREPTDKTKLYFTDVTSITETFGLLLHDLLFISGEQSCFYIVLDPDPEYLWHDRLRGYPVFELNRENSPDEYLKFLNQPMGANPGDNMADMWYAYVIFPLSLAWFVYTIRSDRDDTGHLWIPPNYKVELTAKYPFLWEMQTQAKPTGRPVQL